jgi:hypothetical protein
LAPKAKTNLSTVLDALHQYFSPNAEACARQALSGSLKGIEATSMRSLQRDRSTKNADDCRLSRQNYILKLRQTQSSKLTAPAHRLERQGGGDKRVVNAGRFQSWTGFDSHWPDPS